MKKLLSLLAVFFIFHFAKAQQSVDLQENTPFEQNGIVYGYYITNESSKEVKGEDYDRYEVTMYVTNKSGGIKLIPFSQYGGSNVAEDEATIAEFSCKNATGKRFTSKGTSVKVKPWMTPVKITDEAQPAKYKIVNAQAGFALMNNQTVNSKIIVIVPKGQRPQVTCRPASLPNNM